ncbi:MAG: hypothetical protein LBL66_05115 [Clostridiales bacterium]|jgi:ABC-2 type transport system permease protein|nr:hypothetical protein [Clostridiales bacterium]
MLPMTYCLDLCRAVVCAGAPEYADVVLFDPWVNFAAIAGLTAVFLVLGAFFFARAAKKK